MSNPITDNRAARRTPHAGAPKQETRNTAIPVSRVVAVVAVAVLCFVPWDVARRTPHAARRTPWCVVRGAWCVVQWCVCVCVVVESV
jgi:hypothetical protein